MSDSTEREERVHKELERISEYIAALYWQAQEAQAVMVPHGWRGVYTVISTAQQILDANDRHGKIRLHNDGPSDIWLSDVPINASSVSQGYENTTNSVQPYTVVRNGELFEISTRGALYACPVDYAQAVDNTAVCRIHVELFGVATGARVAGFTPPDYSENEGSKIEHEFDKILGKVKELV